MRIEYSRCLGALSVSHFQHAILVAWQMGNIILFLQPGLGAQLVEPLRKCDYRDSNTYHEIIFVMFFRWMAVLVHTRTRRSATRYRNTILYRITLLHDSFLVQHARMEKFRVPFPGKIKKNSARHDQLNKLVGPLYYIYIWAMSDDCTQATHTRTKQQQKSKQTEYDILSIVVTNGHFIMAEWRYNHMNCMWRAMS